MILADIGNTHVHIFNDTSVEHLEIDDAIEKYFAHRVRYISVNSKIEKLIFDHTQWENISRSIALNGAYATMGVDRRALCLSSENGLFVDAGSAITLDKRVDGVYRGGFILAGLQAALESYGKISEALEATLNRHISLNTLPLTTRDGISYGIIAPIIAVIEQTREKDLPLYFTGGDGRYLASFFKDAIFDETLVFKGIQKALANNHKEDR